ncbi:hypothetical protein [Massilibacteroides sp.]|uniref:TolB family protein n=1 Tax=Massilibacteroides sp. TaxID=2034766 RepID=UPI0026073D4C|nr:hypothetical protein [Massilibacteroides sp.]MDD4514521.1 hypothetical protein [Massilibacteroides sp.]
MKALLILVLLFFLTACSGSLPYAEVTDSQPKIIPDYREVTIPYNIAPLNFKLPNRLKSILVLKSPQSEVRINSKNGQFEIPQKKWRKLVEEAIEGKIEYTIYTYQDKRWLKNLPFSIYIAKEPIDTHIVYRKIAPGYRMWGEMGIYQRNLENFNEEAFLTNKHTNNNCMNCHSFCMQNPDKMLFHQRSTHGGTYIIVDGEIEKLDTKTNKLISALVYPAWHPSGRFAAFSVNETKQDFHYTDPNRVEVYDMASDIVIYDIKNHEIRSDSLLLSKENMETFPTFSPDGTRLFFCSAPTYPMPDSYRSIKYNLLSIDFDPDRCVFGHSIDTLYNAANEGRSAKFPRISPDGRYLMYTISDYGNFSIWHKDADLQLLDLKTGKVNTLSGVNSSDVESYHSWSSNSRWFVFSSRRDDGLYTRPYICYIDQNGKCGKPFLLPQKNTDYYDNILVSFNIPELIKGKIDINMYKLTQTSKLKKSDKIQMNTVH